MLATLVLERFKKIRIGHTLSKQIRGEQFMNAPDEKKLKIIEGVKKQSERYGFPTYPKKKKKTKKDQES